MNNNQQHINKIIREKFESFSPTPSDFIWEKIETGLATNRKTSFWIQPKNLWYVAIVAIILIILGRLLFGQKTANTFSQTYNKITFQSIEKSKIKSNTFVQNKNIELAKKQIANLPDRVLNENISNSKHLAKTVYSDKLTTGKTQFSQKTITPRDTKTQQSKNFKYKNLRYEQQDLTTGVSFYNNRNTPILLLKALILSEKFSGNNKPQLLPKLYDFDNNNTLITGQSKELWKAGIFFSPEFILTSIDSVRVLHNYSLGIEVQYSLNSNFFIRLGFGSSYVRDRGFTKIQLKSLDYLGSYNDVYNVTFDTIGGVPVPTYFTQKVDVWDSIQHFNVTETTRQYMYFQIPLLFGYNYKQSGQWSWYIFGGPVLSTLLYQNTKAPLIKNSSKLIRYENYLPERNSVIFQFWLGAGFAYSISSKYSITLEPNYRYYFNPIFKNYHKKQSLSSVSLQLGIMINL